jgi:hypothetical protein
VLVDDDPAGQRDSEKLAQALVGRGIEARLANIAKLCGIPGLDANKLARDHGIDALRDALDRAEAYQPGPPPPPPPHDPEDEDEASKVGGVTIDDFRFYMRKDNACIYMPSAELWPGGNVDKLVPAVTGVDDEGKPVKLKPTTWLARNRPVEQMTWAPGEPQLIRDRLIIEGGFLDRPGAVVFNQYRPSTLKHGDPAKAGKWLAHVRRVYPNDADHLIPYFAHRVQRPAEKLNHALMLGGEPGIGKDSMLAPVREAVGPWNCEEVSPRQISETGFNSYLKSVILRISEVHDLGDLDRYQFYEMLKTMSAAPPETLRIDEKNQPEYRVLNCVSPIITTNHKSDGPYLPANDRRTYVAWSELTQADFKPDYWTDLWGWYADGGFGHVAAYLATYDLSKFDPKAPPPKTAAFWAIADANRAPEDAELADVLDSLDWPNVTTLIRVQNAATGDFEQWLRDRKNRRLIPYRFEQCGYVPVRNDTAESGLWVINKKRQVVYAKASLSLRDRLAAVQKLIA